MADTATEPTLEERLDALKSERTQRHDAWAQFIEARETERATFKERRASNEFDALSDEERGAELEKYSTSETAFGAASAARKDEIAGYDARIGDLEAIVAERDARSARLQQAADAESETGSLRITHEPLTYRSDNTRGMEGLSYYRDLALTHGPGISLQTGGTRDAAQARLDAHAREMRTVMPERMANRERDARRQLAEAEAEFLARMNGRMSDAGLARALQDLRSNGLAYNPFEQRVTPNSTDGYGGYFIPPLWLEDEFIPGLRAHLIVAGFPRQMDVPAGTNSINVPKLVNLTTIGYQQANNAGLPSKDWTDTFVQANVKTIGGYSDVAIQLLEQSPHGIVDEVITTDLMAAYNTFLDGEVISGDGTNTNSLNGGHLQGIYNGAGGSAWSGVNTLTYTDGSPAAYKLPQAVFGPMASKVARTRFDISNFKFAMHGRRWFSYSTGLDANNRPLGETSGGGRFNINAAIQGGLQPEGLVGSLPSVADAPVYIDDNITTADTTGGGSGQDVVIGGNWDDSWLFKSPLRTDVFREVESGSLGVRFRVYNYAAFLVRYGQSFAVATGSGFAAPSTGFGDTF
jgi:hypothetical protein